MTMKITNKKELIDFDKEHRLKVLIVKEANPSEILREIDYDFFISISKTNGKPETDTGDKRKKAQRSYPCPICNQVCRGRKGLSSHMRQQHDTNLLEYEKEHGRVKAGATIQEKKQPPKQEYVCKECGQTFNSPQSLGGHTATHKSKLKPCPKCGRMLNGKGFTTHVKYCKGSDAATGEATEAKKEPKRRGRPSKDSKRLPELPKSFSCDECGASFDSPAKLRGHKNGAHRRKSQPMICPICEGEYGSASGLSSHMKNNHGLTLKEWQLQSGKRPEKKGKVPREEMSTTQLPPPENYVPPVPSTEPPIDPTTPNLKEAW